MNVPTTPIRRCSITALVAALLVLAAACGAEAEPTPTPVPAATPTPVPDVRDVLSRAGEKMAAMKSAKFGMIDETETGAKFFDTTFKSMEAEVEAPDSFRMLVDVVAPAFGFVEIEMLAVGDQAFMKFSEDAPWAPLPLDQVPFNFGGLGPTLRDVLARLEDPTLEGREAIGGAQTFHVEGSITSDGLADLITDADPGHDITLTLWIDETDYALRQIRIAGQIYDDDGPGTTRLLNIEGIDIPVDIQLPEVGSGQ